MPTFADTETLQHMSKLFPLVLIFLGVQEGFTQLHVTGGFSYGIINNSELGFANESGDMYFYPEESIIGNTAIVPLEFGLSLVDHSLDMGIGLSLGFMNATEGNTSTTANFIMPAYSLDMYFLQKDPFFLGFGVQIRYSSLTLEKSFNMDLDETPGLETYLTETRWGGLGYKLQVSGKYLFLSGNTALKLGVGYFFDHRKLKSMTVTGADMPFVEDSPYNTFDVGGLELNLSIQYLLGRN